MDHPDNTGHPVSWRVDGQRGISPASCITDAIELPSGSKVRHRYRLVLHEGALSTAQIDKLWNAYIASTEY